MPRVLRRRRGYVAIAGAINLSTHTPVQHSSTPGAVRYETVRLIFAYLAIDDGTCRLTVHPRTSWKSRSERCLREKISMTSRRRNSRHHDVHLNEEARRIVLIVSHTVPLSQSAHR